MDLALYDPEFGYYARADQRSGRAGDFFTSVDVGPLFGGLLETQFAEFLATLQTSDFTLQTFDLVEAGAGNGRLAGDILRAAKRRHPDFYSAVRLHLVEASAAARAAQRTTLGDVADRLTSSSPDLPESFEGVLIANELLDAMPVHQVLMREDGLREVYVTCRSAKTSRFFPTEQDGARGSSRAFSADEGPLSTQAIAAYLDRLRITLEPGWRVEINLRAVDWIREAARRLRRGFIVIVDYGHEAQDLYSASHSAGTLTTYAGHRSHGVEGPGDVPAWLHQPGEQDITAHVDFTSVRAAAEVEGLTTIALLDQTYFLLGLYASLSADEQSAINHAQLKSLVMPGGLGSTHKVLILGKGVGKPSLRGCSFSTRLT